MKTLLHDFEKNLRKKDLSVHTVKNYLSDITQFLLWFQSLDSNLDLKHLNLQHISAYKDHLCHKKRQKTASVNRSLQSLKNFFRFLVAKKFLKHDPTENIKFLKKVKSTQPQALNKSEIHKLLSATAHSSHGTQKRNYALVQIFLQTGMRLSEALDLELRDLELFQRSGSIRIVHGKGGKERTVPLNKTARRALRSYLETRHAVVSESVFLSKQRKKMTARTVQKLITKLADMAGIHRIHVTPHVLRHSFALNYLRANPDCLVELSVLLGHDSLDTTSIYTTPSKDRLLDTVESSGNSLYE